jgi:uncharacterized Fe-S center protein
MYKQCLIQLVKNGAFTTIWVAIKDALKNKKIEVDYQAFNVKGEAVVLNVYDNITIK